MAHPAESFEIEAQTSNVVEQEPSVLRKATPILIGASCLAALALFHTSGSAAGSPQSTQQLNAAQQPPHVDMNGGFQVIGASHPHGDMHSGLQIIGDVPHMIGGARDTPDAPHMIGGTRDTQGCMTSAGFAWCPSRGECVQPWVHPCDNLVSAAHEDAEGMPQVASGDGARRFGGRRDEHGCMGSGGFVWCASSGECVQPWAQPCPDLIAAQIERMPEVGGDVMRRFGGYQDERGCMGSAGFVWCASSGECMQPWAQPCDSLEEQVQEAQEQLGGAVREANDWVLLGHGGCRTASGTAGTYHVLPGRVHSVRGADSCRAACAAQASCVAYELRENDGRCELHTEAIDHVHVADGYVCWVKAQQDEAVDQASPPQLPAGNVPSVEALPDDLILGRPGASTLGGTRDEHNCLGASGFTWCPSLSECVRGFSQSCPGGTAACQRLCAEEPAANEGLRFGCTCSEGVALDHMSPEVQQ